ncbi:MFS transporter [Polyangium aurulentum]|uniref:MFS transporter n=1 Tax=Polyangium aurulentum TaxID=2567896 RepID=UPI00146EDF45|nr:MFS transporter [Polyangium aurulentum]UQA60325.1 MFS transporter [Polyangium aurulentum]
MSTRISTLRLYYFAAFAAIGVYLPFFPPWLEAHGIRGLSLGIVTSLFHAMSIIAPPAFGFVADALGLRGFLLRVACGGAFAGFLVISALALRGGPIGFGPLVASVLIFAFFRSPMAMMADVVSLEQSGRAGVPYGSIRLWGSIGFLCAATAAGWLADPKQPAEVPIAVALALLGAFTVSFALPSRVPAPARPSAEHVREFVADPSVRLFLAGAFFAQAGHVCYDQRMSSLLRDRGASQPFISLAWSVGVLAEVLLMGVFGLIAQRVRPPVLLAIAYGGASLRWLLIANLPGTLPLLLLQPLHALSFGVTWVASLAFVKERAPSHMLSTAQGLFTTAISSGGVVGMLVWGPLYEKSGGMVTFATASVVSACACALAIAFARRGRSSLQKDKAVVAGAP